MLRLKPPHGITLVRTALRISSRERLMVSLRKDQVWFMKKFSVQLVEYDAACHWSGVQELWKTIKQRVIHFGYPKMHHVNHISESIRWMGSGYHITTYISERLHIDNVKEVYWSTNNVNYIQMMLKHNDWCTGLDYMEETVSYIALQSWYHIDSAKVVNLILAANKQRNMHSTHFLRHHHCQEEPFFRPGSQQIHYLRETDVCGVWRSIK